MCPFGYSGEALKCWLEALCMWAGFVDWPRRVLWFLSLATIDILGLKIPSYGGCL